MAAAAPLGTDTRGQCPNDSTEMILQGMNNSCPKLRPWQVPSIESTIRLLTFEKIPQAAAGHEDEADALKAMFQATEDHWKETNAKMSTLVSRCGVFPCLCIELLSHQCVFSVFFLLLILPLLPLVAIRDSVLQFSQSRSATLPRLPA